MYWSTAVSECTVTAPHQTNNVESNEATPVTLGTSVQSLLHPESAIWPQFDLRVSIFKRVIFSLSLIILSHLSLSFRFPFLSHHLLPIFIVIVFVLYNVFGMLRKLEPSGNFDERVAKWSYAVNYSYKKCSLELVSIIWWSSHHNNINVGVSFWWLKLFFFPIDDHILPISINSSGTLDIPGRQSLRICLELILFLFYFLACWWFWF